MQHSYKTQWFAINKKGLIIQNFCIFSSQCSHFQQFSCLSRITSTFNISLPTALFLALFPAFYHWDSFYKKRDFFKVFWETLWCITVSRVMYRKFARNFQLRSIKVKAVIIGDRKVCSKVVFRDLMRFVFPTFISLCVGTNSLDCLYVNCRLLCLACFITQKEKVKDSWNADDWKTFMGRWRLCKNRAGIIGTLPELYGQVGRITGSFWEHFYQIQSLSEP